MTFLILLGLQMSLLLFGGLFLGSVPGLTEGSASVNSLLGMTRTLWEIVDSIMLSNPSVSDEFHSLVVDLAVINSMNFCEK